MTTPDDFARQFPFALDAFQRDAIDAVDRGMSTLVAAPTGSGKTVVAEFAIERALDRGGKAFYTTPLKALSNQKFGDLVAKHGAESVGLLTGDNAINPEASVVVMTTEVLRNMLYERSTTLTGLLAVVMDEVHYLQDPYRGAVWEEVLIHLPPSVSVVALSATISNAEEFGEWITTLRGDTRVVIEERRPVPLEHHYLVGPRLHPMHIEQDGILHAEPVRRLARPARAEDEDLLPARVGARRSISGSRGRGRGTAGSTCPGGRRSSRSSLGRGCSPRSTSSSVGPDARRACDGSGTPGVRLTTREEAATIRDRAESTGGVGGR